MPSKEPPELSSDTTIALDWLLCANHVGLLSLDRLPLEEDLRRTLRVSRRSLREVLQHLATSGLLERRRSTGTAAPGSEQKALGVSWPTPPTAGRYKVLADRAVPGNEVSELIFGPVGYELRRIDRLTVGRHHLPLASTSIYVPAADSKWVGELEQADTNAIVALLAGDDHEDVDVEYFFNAVGADAETANQLGVPLGAPILHVGRTFQRDGRVLVVAFSRQPGMRVTLRTSVAMSRSHDPVWG